MLTAPSLCCPLLRLPSFASHPQEMEFQTSPQTAIEALIHINNQLRQPEAAVGVLTYAQKHLHMELKESWWVPRMSLVVGCARLDVSGTGHRSNVPNDAMQSTRGCGRWYPHPHPLVTGTGMTYRTQTSTPCTQVREAVPVGRGAGRLRAAPATGGARKHGVPHGGEEGGKQERSNASWCWGGGAENKVLKTQG